MWQHPENGHFLYLLERPLQQYCTNVQTVIKKSYKGFACWIPYMLASAIAELAISDMTFYAWQARYVQQPYFLAIFDSCVCFQSEFTQKSSVPISGSSESYLVLPCHSLQCTVCRAIHHRSHRHQFPHLNAVLLLLHRSHVLKCNNTKSSAIAERPRCSLFKLWQKYKCKKRASNIALCYQVNVDELSFYCSTAPCLYLMQN